MICMISILILSSFFYRKEIKAFVKKHKKKLIAITAVSSVSAASLALIPTGDPPGGFRPRHP